MLVIPCLGRACIGSAWNCPYAMVGRWKSCEWCGDGKRLSTPLGLANHTKKRICDKAFVAFSGLAARSLLTKLHCLSELVQVL